MNDQPELFPEAVSNPVNQLLALNTQANKHRLRIEQLEADLKKEKEDLNNLESVFMPTIMEEAGITEFRLSDGSVISLTETTVGSMPKDRQDQCLQWLRENGHAGVIKNQIAVNLSRGEDGLAPRVISALHEMGIHTVDQKETVHYQTLNALLREIAHEAGFPRELFSVHEVKRVVVK